MAKKCIYCEEKSVIKRGKQSGRQVYYCKNCSKYFSSKKQTSRKNKSIVDKLTFKKNF